MRLSLSPFVVPRQRRHLNVVPRTLVVERATSLAAEIAIPQPREIVVEPGEKALAQGWLERGARQKQLDSVDEPCDFRRVDEARRAARLFATYALRELQVRIHARR